MNNRIAKKIYKAIDTADDHRYSEEQKGRACRVIDRFRSEKISRKWWNALNRAIGVNGRVLLACDHFPSDCLKMMLDTPEDQWAGDPEAWKEVLELSKEIRD